MNRSILLSNNSTKNPYYSLWSWLINGHYSGLLLFYTLLGITGVYTPFIFVILLYTLLFTFIVATIKKKRVILPYFLILLIPFEVFSRMIDASPFIPWEVGKYLGIVLLIYGILTNRSKSKAFVGLIMFLMVLPAIFLTIIKSENIFQEITYNAFGIISLCLAIFYFANTSLSKSDIANMFRCLIFSSLPVLSYILIKTPSFDQIDFVLGANTEVTGGFGSNQVSTVLGLAGGLGIWLWLMQINLTKRLILNFFISGIFLAWALFSFSRGGVITPLVALVLTILLVKKGRGPYRVRRINVALLVGIGILVPSIFIITNRVTNNQLALRYLGETQATLSGFAEKDLNKFTTGRWEILLSDIDIWEDNLLLGVGVGQAPYLREKVEDRLISAHVEVSRLLSEHGLFGFLVALLFLLLPIYLYFSRSSAFNKAIVILCCTIAVLSSMHSAMRTFVTPFFYGLSFVAITNE